MWKGDKAEATAPIQTVNTETLRVLKQTMGGRGRTWETLGVGPTGAGREQALEGNPQVPELGAREEDASSTETRSHAEGAPEMFSASFCEPVPPLCFTPLSPDLCCKPLKAWDGANSMP